MRRPAVPVAALALGAALVPAALVAPAAAAVTRVACPGKPAAATCARIDVPRDVAGRIPGSERLYVEVHRETAKGARRGAVVVLAPPGVAASARRAAYLGVLGPLRARGLDVVLLDARGTGRSDPVACPKLDAGGGEAAATACATALGARRDGLAAARVADDVEAVRVALGLPALGVYADGAGAIAAQALVARHPAGIRALVLDGPEPARGGDPLRVGASADLRAALDALCARGPAGACGRTAPATALARLGRAVAARPLRGRAPALDGSVARVVLDGPALVRLVTSADRVPTVRRELVGALRARAAGDLLPLLRLAAETAPPPVDVARLAASAATAAACNDGPLAWDASVTDPAARRRALAARLAALPAGAYAPFSIAAWTAPPAQGFTRCAGWPVPAVADPPLPAGAAPVVPTLILVGDLAADGGPTAAAATAALLPGSRVVTVRSAGRTTALDPRAGTCAAGLARQFLRTLAPGVVSCAAATASVPLAAFATRAAAVRAATPASRGDRSTGKDRRAAAVAALTAADVIARYPVLRGATGAGLRGGTFAVLPGAKIRIQLRGVQVVRDIQAYGTLIWKPETGRVIGDVIVLGTATDPGAYHLEWDADRAGELVRIVGSNGGRAVDVRMPAP